MLIKVYQINPEVSEDARFAVFSGTERLPNGTPNPAHYQRVFVGDLPECKNLEDVFERFNTGRIPTLQGHSLSVSDVVEILESDENGNVKGFYFCNTIGWKKIDFDPSLAAESNTFKESIRVVYIRPGCRPVVTNIWKKLGYLQDAVSMSGEESLIEFMYPFSGDMDHMILVGNEEAVLVNMPFTFDGKDPAPFNRIFTMYGGLQGPLFVTRESNEDDGELASLTDEDIKKLEKVFGTVIK